MKKIAERMKKEVSRRLIDEYGKKEGISSRQIMALIDVIAEYLNAIFLANIISEDRTE